MGGQLNWFDMLEAQSAEKVVRRIAYDETKPFLLKIHYARRMPCITDAFGLFVNGELAGVVTYGVPASRPLCIGLAGVENEKNVRELNRLCIRPDLNGGGETTPLFLSLTHSKCSLMARLLCLMLILRGRTLGISIKPATSFTQA
jgi:hypothetical protein